MLGGLRGPWRGQSGECHVDLRLASHSSPPGQKSKIKSKSSSPKDPPSSGSLCGLIIDGINETIGGEVKKYNSYR